MDPILEHYISTHIDAEPEHLYRLNRATNIHLVNGRMCSGHLQGRLLKMLVRMIHPMRVLELGTYSGYSAQCLAEGLADVPDMPKPQVDTIEIDDELEDFITSHLAESPVGERINLMIGDAREIMPTLEPGYDLIFIDANKRVYCAYYQLAMDLLKDGGFIIADNTLWDGHVAEGPERNDAQTVGIREFNDMVAADDRVEKVIVPLRDGLTIIYKKPNAR